MKIDILELTKAIKQNLTISEYIYLSVIQDGCMYLFDSQQFKEEEISLKLGGWIYTNPLSLTPKGKELFKVSNKVDNFYVELHKKLQNKLIELTGSKQKTLNKKYSFLCNSQDLASKLSKVIKKYKLNNWNKVESLLLQHIINSYKANWEYVLLIEYYIEKNNSSKLATDYEGFEEKEVEIKKVDTFNI